MTQIAAQLYTLREFVKTPPDIAKSLKKVADIGYKAVQVSGVGKIEPDELKKIAEGEGLAICATHIPYQNMRDNPQKVIDEHNIYGCKYAGIGSIAPELRNAEGYAAFAKEASQVAKRLAEGGISFIYHNHSFELERYGKKTGLGILREDSDPKYFNAEIDTYWIQHGGGDPAQWIENFSGRVPVLHLKDMIIQGSKQLMAEVGEGNLNWPRILAAAKAAGTIWYVVEQDVCQRDPFESLAISFRNLREMGLE